MIPAYSVSIQAVSPACFFFFLHLFNDTHHDIRVYTPVKLGNGCEHWNEIVYKADVVAYFKAECQNLSGENWENLQNTAGWRSYRTRAVFRSYGAWSKLTNRLPILVQCVSWLRTVSNRINKMVTNFELQLYGKIDQRLSSSDFMAGNVIKGDISVHPFPSAIDIKKKRTFQRRKKIGISRPRNYSCFLVLFLIRIVGGGVQLGPLGTAATNLPIVPVPGEYEEGEFGGMMIGRENRSTRRKPTPATLYPPQIPHDLTVREPVSSRWEASD
jgi:hypothetical protein